MNHTGLRKWVQAYGTICALIGIIIIFGIAKPRAFLTFRNFINISRQMAALTIISIGATIVMSVNEFDLALGSMASLGGVLAAILAVKGVPVALAFLITIAVCMGIGFLNGFVIAQFHVLSFITTLGVGTILDGIIYQISGGSTIFENIPASFSWLGTVKVGSIPLISILMLLALLYFYFFMRHTAAGRKLYAIGGGEEAAKIAGINIRKYKILAFTICAGLASFTGIMIASRVGSANTTAGAGYFLTSYAAAYIGCTVSKQGVPNVPGTFAGVAILSILANGLTILQVPTFLQDIITGLIIIVSVILQKLGKRE